MKIILFAECENSFVLTKGIFFTELEVSILTETITKITFITKTQKLFFSSFVLFCDKYYVLDYTSQEILRNIEDLRRTRNK